MNESFPYVASDDQEPPMPLEEALVLLAQAEEVRREADAELNTVRARTSIERRKSAMLQQLTITTTDKTMLKPLVESAIEN